MGKAEGSTEKAIEIAKAMLAKGMEVEIISEITKLSVEAIRRLG